MNTFSYGIVVTVFCSFFAVKSFADDNLWIGAKAGTLGLGVEATWPVVPFFDLRAGLNTFDYDMSGSQAGLDYDAELALDTVYATANFRFPLNPMRLTIGIFSNDNEITLLNQGSTGVIIIGEVPFPASEVGTLRSEIAFDSTAPYLGLGFDFRAFDKASINFDLGVLWQASPLVALTANGSLATDPILRDAFLLALEDERQELETALDSFKAYPVVSLGISFNF